MTVCLNFCSVSSNSVLSSGKISGTLSDFQNSLIVVLISESQLLQYREAKLLDNCLLRDLFKSGPAIVNQTLYSKNMAPNFYPRTMKAVLIVQAGVIGPGRIYWLPLVCQYC